MVDSLDGGSVLRKVTTYTQGSTEYTHTVIHDSSGIRTLFPSIQEDSDSLCLDTSATVIGSWLLIGSMYSYIK
jgi:hypothetical protein